MTHSLRKTLAEINRSHLRHNVRSLRSLLPSNRFFCPMVKSNGYGHGDVEVAEVLVGEGICRLGVALVEEAVALRDAKTPVKEILVFGPFDREGAKEIVAQQLIPVVSSWEQLHLLDEALPRDQAYPVHLKFNTGMFRLGFEVSEAQEVSDFISRHSNIDLKGIGTHLSDGEDGGDPNGRTEAQLKAFRQVVACFPQNHLMNHVYNSAGMVSHWSHDHLQEKWGARPGLSIYGIDPGVQTFNSKAKQLAQSLDLKPVMSLKSEIVMYHEMVPGERVSYMGKWTAGRKSFIAVLPIGYADGYSRAFSNRGQVLFRGQRVPVVGVVCMDYTMIDVTDALHDGPPKVGEEVVLMGEQGKDCITAAQMAQLIATIPYEIVTSVGPRVPRRYKD